MRKGTLMLVVLAMAGCASVGDLEHKAPTFTDRSSKSLDEYKRCVVPAWMRIASIAHAADTTEGFEVIVPSPVADTDELLVVKRDADELNVSLHERIASMSKSAYRESAKSCL